MFEKIKKIIPAEEAVEMIKLSPEMKKLKLERDETVKKIISGKDKRLMFIVGPCSADTKILYWIMFRVLPCLRKKSTKRSLSFRAYIPISRGQEARAIRECCTAPIRTMTKRIFRPAFWRSGGYMRAR